MGAFIVCHKLDRSNNLEQQLCDSGKLGEGDMGGIPFEPQPYTYFHFGGEFSDDFRKHGKPTALSWR